MDKEKSDKGWFPCIISFLPLSFTPLFVLYTSLYQANIFDLLWGYKCFNKNYIILFTRLLFCYNIQIDLIKSKIMIVIKVYSFSSK
jgi:hypothetical protein